MKWIDDLLFYLLLAVCAGGVAGIYLLPDPAYGGEKEMQMLSTVVRIQNSGSGSGVIVYSEEVTYILTNHHIVRREISTHEAPEGRGEVWKAKPVSVEFFEYDGQRQVNMVTKEGYIVAFDQKNDQALIRVNSGGYNTVTFDRLTPYLFDQVFMIGAGRGMVPYPTIGIISNLDVEHEEVRYIQSSTPVVYGNSGGGLFRYCPFDNDYKMIGLSEGVEMLQIPMTPLSIPIYHMSVSIPIDRIDPFLNKWGIRP